MARTVRIVDFVRLTEAQLARIRAVDPAVEVTYVGEDLCMQENRVFLTVSLDEAAARLQPLLSEAEVILGYPGNFSPPYPMPNLKWVQLVGAGANHLYKTSLWQSDVVVTNASGIAAVAIAEHGLMCMLMLANDAWRHFRQQQQHVWNRWWSHPTLAGHTVGILGYGAIGAEMGRQAAALSMRVLALDATFTSHRTSTGQVHEVFPPKQLRPMLGMCDYVVNCLPLTPATTHLLGTEELAAMPKGSFIVSLSRGAIIDFEALVKALQSGHLGGAALDVTEPEPLPPESPLWDMPNVIITPHVSGVFQDYTDRYTALVCRNLELYLRDAPLLNVFNKELGY